MTTRLRIKGADYRLNSEGDLETVEPKACEPDTKAPSGVTTTTQERIAILDWVLSLPPRGRRS